MKTNHYEQCNEYLQLTRPPPLILAPENAAASLKAPAPDLPAARAIANGKLD